MKQEHANDVYACYLRFVENLILKSKSSITNEEEDKDILTKAAIEEALQRYVENYDETKGKSFSDKIIGQFNGATYEAKLLFAHAEWLWAMAVTDIGSESKTWVIERTIGSEYKSIIKDDISPWGFGSAGTYHKNNKYFEVRFVLLLLKYLLSKRLDGELKSVADVNKHIEQVCNTAHYDDESLKDLLPADILKMFPDRTCAMFNILTYLAFPDRYERIASDGHKWRIVNGFSVLCDTNDSSWENANTDEKISIIRKRLSALTNEPVFDFYDDKYRQVWNFGITDNQFDEIQALNYKQAIILYGPPGTSKTHTAKELARVLVTQHYLKKSDNVKRYFEQDEDFLSSRIHRLQLHPNYSFEEFIAGIQFKNNQTVVEKGYFLQRIAEIEKDEYPHVIILDEINRVDLSRLFGELFSALENRDEEIDLSIGNLKIKVPKNLYVIGTMNEIDFSLERVDFALRRRFVWYFYGYDRDILREMLIDKNTELNAKLRENEFDDFILRCDRVNEYIANEVEELGKQYEIGHTFFAEIVKIHKSFMELNSMSRRMSLFRKPGALQVLWSISICPILEAYFGNMDLNMRKQSISKIETIFLKGE